MNEFTYKERTRRNLPHLQPLGATLFLTFRLAGTIPKPLLQLYHSRKHWLEHPDLFATEVRVHPQMSVLLGTRKAPRS